LIVRIPRDGAVIFDLDGTLVDSSAVVERQWSIWARSHGIEPRLVMEVVHGRPSIQTMRMFRPETTLAESSAFDAIEAADLEGLKPVAGARQAIEACERQQIPWAIVTSGTNTMARNRLRVCGFDVPPVFVTVEQTERGKPAPDPFLRAALLLKVEPAKCTVFEDAPPGIHAANAANMRVIALRTTHSEDHLSGAAAVVKNLSEVQVERAESSPPRSSE
jgi:mannitol-1-/sugar-/sorbitol-6-phosphatase